MTADGPGFGVDQLRAEIGDALDRGGEDDETLQVELRHAFHPVHRQVSAYRSIHQSERLGQLADELVARQRPEPPPVDRPGLERPQN